MPNNLKIRNIKASDVDLLFNWSNDELVRKQSFSTEVISYETHCKWFQKKLDSKKSLLFIFETNTIAVGIVRFEIENKNSIIGVSIDEKFRGKGFGKKILLIAINTYFEKHNFPILAFIKKKNIASIKSFEKVGFTFLREENENEIKSVVYQLKKLENE